MLRSIATETRALEVSAFQQRVLAAPSDCDLFLGGGRGGGKSYSLALLAMQHAEQYRELARILYLRQSFPGVADFVALTRELFGEVYGTAARFNQSSHVWTLPTGSYFEINQLETPGDYQKFQGRSFSLVLIDEAGQWPDPAILDLLRSNVRAGEGVPVRVVVAANPGGAGHHWLSDRYVFRGEPWVPFVESTSGRTWIYCPSTFIDNDHIDREGYRKQIEAATATDPELGRAWLDGDWSVIRGAIFSSVLSEDRNAFGPWSPEWYRRPRYLDPCEGDPILTSGRDWLPYLTLDHGSAAPAVCYLAFISPGAEGPDGRFYSRDSILLVDEVHTAEKGSLTKGQGLSVPVVADRIKRVCATWGVRPWGYADDAIFAQHGSQSGSIGDEYRRAGVYLNPARKGRREHGWELMKRLLADAGHIDVPGLYISRACSYWWQTVPVLGRDPRMVDDVDNKSADHAADATRYLCTSLGGPRTTSTEFRL